MNTSFRNCGRRELQDLVMDSAGPTMSEVAAVIRNCKSFAGMHTYWRSIASDLGIASHRIEQLGDEYIMKVTVKTLEQLLDKILSLWGEEKANQAKIVYLCEALKRNHLNDIAQALSSAFESIEFPQAKVVNFTLHGKVVTLEELLGVDTYNESYRNIIEELKTCSLSQTSPFQLLKDQLAPPASPKYYIPRTLLHFPSSELDPKIFSSDNAKEHVFLFKGISKPELAKLIGYKEIEHSGDQLYQVTAKFILMEHDGDFDRLSTRTQKPLHAIQYDCGRCSWIKSSDGLEIIQQFLTDQAQTIIENDLVSRIASPLPPIALGIADSPGMGKTLVLTNLAKNIQELVPGEIVLFIVLQEFVQHITVVDSVSSAIEAISAFSACDQIAKLVLRNILILKKMVLNLFLDGYDEVEQNKLPIVDSFLQHVQQLKNVKAVVTTRPHLGKRLEIIFGSLSCKILPFDVEHQIDFLTKYWIEEHGATPGRQLELFAEQCLETLATKLSDKEKLISGIPLQCMMMAEVLAMDAKRASNLDTIRKYNIATMSLFEIYRRLMELKFSRIQNVDWRQNYVNAHVNDAIKLLFPDWMADLQPLLGAHGHIDERTLYSIGLIEKSANMNTPRFVHRTFAEYLLAEFIVKNLSKHKECVELLFGAILGRSATSKVEAGYYPENCVSHYKSDYSVIAYFIEWHMKKYIEENTISDLLPSELDFKNIDAEDLCLAIGACCSHNLETLFDYAGIFLRNHVISNELTEKYIKDLPHVIVKHSTNRIMLEKVLHLAQSKSNVGLCYHTYESKYFEDINFTPLHVAAWLGKYNFVTYLVEQYGDQVGTMQYLLHTCMRESANNDDSIIEDKLLILDVLCRTNPSWLVERDTRYCTALLTSNAALPLLQSLVKHGADINAYGGLGTVLHESGEKTTYPDLVRWAFSNGFNLINHTGILERTPLSHFISRFGAVEENVLDMLMEAGADINALDFDENSTFLTALENSGNVQFISKLLEYGADVNHYNKRNRNALHVIMRGSGPVEVRMRILDMIVDKISTGLLEQKDEDGRTPLLRREADLSLLQRLVEHGADINAYSSKHGTVLHTAGDIETYPDLVRWALSNGFKLINEVDSWNKITPIMRFRILDAELLRLFHEAGADINVQDKRGDSILFKALYHLDNVNVVKKLLEYGAEVKHRNQNGQTAMNVLIEGRGSIEDKLQIIDTLIAIDQSWFLNQNFLRRDIRSPLLQHNVPLILLQRLVEHGADINTYSSIYGTVLHEARDRETYTNVVQWALSRGFKRINAADHNGQSPLIVAVDAFGTLEDQVLGLFKEAGANFIARDHRGDSVIFHALHRSGNPNFVKKLLEFGATVKDHRNLLKENAIHIVIKGLGSIDDKLRIIDMLVKINRDWLDERNKYDCTPLLQKNLDFRLLQKLVESGADINAYSKSKGTVLHMKCSRNDYFDIVRWTFSKGFTEVNRTNESKTTPLMFAIKQFGAVDEEILLLFHEARTNFNSQDQAKNSVLFHALRWSKDVNFVKNLLDYGADVNHINSRKQTALHKIMQTTYETLDPYDKDCVGSIWDRLQILNLIVRKNRDLLEQRDQDDCTPLLYWNADLDLLQRLVELGADVNAYSCRRGTLLHRTDIHYTYPSLVRLALSNGFNLINHAERNPLLCAIRRFGIVDDEVLKLFHEARADFNVQDFRGNSVLFYAIDYSENVGFIGRIMEYGADVRHKNHRKENAIHKILRREGATIDKLSVIDLLLGTGNSGMLHEEDEYGNLPLFLAEADLYLLEYLVQHGADINQSTSGQGTILHLPTDKKSYINLLRWSLSNGFKAINQKDRCGKTPLIYAIKLFGCLDDDMLMMFKNAGADFNAQDDYGTSVLFYALDHSANIDFLEKLMDYGADVNHKNHWKQTAAIKVVKGKGNEEYKLNVLKLLEAKGFVLFNEEDYEGWTPFLCLHRQLNIDWGSSKLVSFIKSKSL